MTIIFKKHPYDSLSIFLAGLLALLYMWGISLTSFRQTGLQFVAPLLIIFITHTTWNLYAHGLAKHSLLIISRKTANTAVVLLLLVFIATTLIPEPAHGNETVWYAFASIGQILICLLMIAIVVAIFAIAINLIVRLIKYLLGADTKEQDDDHNKLNEVASIMLVGGFLLASSLEGVSGAYSFNASSTASSSKIISATEAQVWQTLNTATQPDFPIPSFITVFPRPVDVVVDEGTALGAKRVVKFKGREGEGLLSLEVTKRSATSALFTVQSDTSPIAQWVAHQSIEYRVEPAGPNTKLTVSIQYERKLAPAWFFNPFMNGATTMAMNVLASDVKSRAEKVELLSLQVF